MSFLLGDEYASSSSDSESDGEDNAQSQLTNRNDNSEDKAPTQLLPSADSVLSSVSASKASFLPPKPAAKAPDAIESFDLLKEQEKERDRQEEEERERRDRERIEGLQEKSRKRPPPSRVANDQPAKRDKKDAKERVKAQRTKGQAGIGSDFRGWKSETEMALRQQFD
ncbi:hypothetical protein PHYBOEH_010327 [Phytophthora boehmeriae]|uniref:Uncharacterized protein n=1 Tax=Phytophthora boehmeriae TaxID=109152 RepID=A0A8T1X921_9STRA|nr:hypothetical protein PHYBOEH_010327 [Phytophthora boehmeriae]